MRGILAALAGAAALAVAGCGGGSDPASSSSDPASLAPADAGALVTVDTDQTSAQWKNVEAVLAKVPGGEKALDGALSQLGGAKGLDFRTDVQPALGKQLVVVVPNGAKDPLLLVQPDDPKKLDALVAKTKQPHVMGDVQGWTAVAATQKELDAYEAALAKDTLAGSGAYAKATAGLPADALVRGYANGPGVKSLSADAYGATQSVPGLGNGSLTGIGGAAGTLGHVGFAVSATASGFRIDGSVEATRAAPSYAPTLLERVPSDALLAVSFDGAGQAQDAVRQALEGAGTPLSQLEQQLGVKLSDVLAAFDGEGVLYLQAGASIPAITLAVKPHDVAKAKATFDALAAKLSGSGAGTVIQGLKLTSAVVDGAVLISTSPAAAGGFAASGPKLTGTARFEAAAKDVGLGQKTSGFAYVDVHAIGPLLEAALGSLGGTGSTSGLDSLSALDTFVASSTADGRTTRFAEVVTVG
jgi:hypothetical protein